jgi:ABC-type Fe3+-siderophore transport system permease subunit
VVEADRLRRRASRRRSRRSSGACAAAHRRALAIGAALAAAGAAYQSLFRNPLVSPDILGVSGGAAVGAVLGIFLALPILAIQGLAFAFGLVAVALVYLIATGGARPRSAARAGARRRAGRRAARRLRGAAARSSPIRTTSCPAITFWLLGSLAGAAPVDLASALPAIAVGFSRCGCCAGASTCCRSATRKRARWASRRRACASR